jgi:hypothetical protein
MNDAASAFDSSCTTGSWFVMIFTSSNIGDIRMPGIGGGISMKQARVLLFLAFVAAGAPINGAPFHQHATLSAIATVSALQQLQQTAPTIASAVDRDISAVEKQIVDAAEAMPEDKFDFTPEALDIPGSNYKGVRPFAVQVKHIAASNWFIWSPLTGEKLPEGLNDGNGPADLKSKPEIIKFLKDSFALGHRAAATLTAENMLQAPGKSKSTRLRLAEFGVAHAYDHYGQMIEYLRMNGVVPPASRPNSE